MATKSCRLCCAEPHAAWCDAAQSLPEVRGVRRAALNLAGVVIIVVAVAAAVPVGLAHAGVVACRAVGRRVLLRRQGAVVAGVP